jgi:hypothetical protein
MPWVRGNTLLAGMANQLDLQSGAATAFAPYRRTMEPLTQHWRAHDSAYTGFTQNVTSPFDAFLPMSVKGAPGSSIAVSLSDSVGVTDAVTQGAEYLRALATDTFALTDASVLSTEYLRALATDAVVGVDSASVTGGSTSTFLTVSVADTTTVEDLCLVIKNFDPYTLPGTFQAWYRADYVRRGG